MQSGDQAALLHIPEQLFLFATHLLPLSLPVAIASTLPCLFTLPRIGSSLKWALPGVVSSPSGLYLCISVPSGDVYLGGLKAILVTCQSHTDTLMSCRGSSPEVAWGQSDRLPCDADWWNQLSMFG
ncbi:hypothetical protein AV530_013912 [Patagioenas fasciata monilis]|uniref:Uncharacterized protein n=1 Tax=Patagioenas fasciata monilis TaxID=372326 RepID=A0A1V4KN19_PATFA|nr:hypothetical protein AV530_013912 [Patagioenas fasciata monilis]